MPPGGSARALVEPGTAIAVYIRKQRPTSGKDAAASMSGEPGAPAALQIELAEGDWLAEWLDTMNGSVIGNDTIRGGGVRAVTVPQYRADIALRLRRKAGPG